MTCLLSYCLGFRLDANRKRSKMELPTSKQQLLAQLRHERSEWQALLAQMGNHRLELPGVTDQWTLKDTIAHLTTWWRREVARLAAVQRGKGPADHPPQSEVTVIFVSYLHEEHEPLIRAWLLGLESR